MIYLDNAATSYPKPKEATDAMIRAIKFSPGNPGRSSHKLSIAAAETIYKARETVALLLRAKDPDGVVFTYNATHALNMAIKSYVEIGSHVIISDIEHNAVIRPLEKMRSEGLIEYDAFRADSDPETEIGSLIRKNTTCIISTLQSNVTGQTIPLDKLSSIAKRYRLTLIIDASQYLGHGAIDLNATPCDVLCGPGHKGLFGIQGVGFAVFSDLKRRRSWIEGGSGSESRSTMMPLELPEGYEAGTLGTPAIASLLGGIKYINRVGLDYIEEKIDRLTDALIARLSSVRKIKIYDSSRGIVSFNLDGLTSSELAALLDERNVCVRSGLHCAPSAHKKLGTLDIGTTRASLSVFNKISELDRLYKILFDISKTHI